MNITLTFNPNNPYEVELVKSFINKLAPTVPLASDTDEEEEKDKIVSDSRPSKGGLGF